MWGVFFLFDPGDALADASARLRQFVLGRDTLGVSGLRFAAGLAGEVLLSCNLRCQRCSIVGMKDDGPEFISKALARWAYENGVALDFRRPGEPTGNAFAESFNGRLRDECLNTHGFLSLEDARATIEAWRRDCNESRPHPSLGWLTPAGCAAAAAKRTPVIHPRPG